GAFGSASQYLVKSHAANSSAWPMRHMSLPVMITLVLWQQAFSLQASHNNSLVDVSATAARLPRPLLHLPRPRLLRVGVDRVERGQDARQRRHRRVLVLGLGGDAIEGGQDDEPAVVASA